MIHGTFVLAVNPNLSDLQSGDRTDREFEAHERWPVTAEYRPADSLTSGGRADGEFDYDPDALLAAGPASPGQYGKVLGCGLFQGKIRQLFDLARSQTPDGQSLHVLLAIQPRSLRRLSWHFLCGPVDAEGNWDFLGLRGRTPFCLYQAGVADTRFPPVGLNALRVLVVIASPAGAAEAPPFDVPAARDAVLAGLESDPHVAPISYRVLARPSDADDLPTLEALLKHLGEGGFTVLHLVCHGRYSKEAADFSLYFEDHAGAAHRVPWADLRRSLSRLGFGRSGRLPYLAFLSACDTDKPEASYHDRLAQSLVRDLGLPAAIGMAGPVSVSTAKAVARAFYPALRKNGRPDVALAEARAVLSPAGGGGALRPAPALSDVLVPMLVSQLGGQALFDGSIDSPPTDQATLNDGLNVMRGLLKTHAPVLLNRFQTLEQDLRAAPLLSEGWKAALEGLNELAGEVLEISFNALATGGQPRPPSPDCPFVGMRPFTFEESHLFKARDELVSKLADLVRQHGFLAVGGPSGSGKSSVVLAGVLPRMEVSREAVLELAPGADPVGKLTQCLEGAQSTIRVLVVNQFEELFTHGVPLERQWEFVAKLLSERSQRMVLLTVRSEFLDQCKELPGLAALLNSATVLIEPMRTDELDRAVRDQSVEARLEFDANLLPAILSEVDAEPGRMPLLQHALAELWRRRHGKWLLAGEYKEIGGARQAIARTANKFLEGLESQSHRKRVIAILLRLVRVGDPEDGTVDVRRRVRIAELVPDGETEVLTRDWLTRLVDQYLVVTAGQEAEVAHEALITYWPAMQKAVTDHRTDLLRRQEVWAAARSWELGGRVSTGLKHEGEHLVELMRLRRSLDVPLNAMEAEYLRKCEQHQRRKQNRRRLAYSGVAMLLVGVVIVVTGFWRAEATARQESEAGLYANRILRAYQEWLNSNVAESRHLLEECSPEQQRHWEWRNLWRLCHAQDGTLGGDAGPIHAVAFSRADKDYLASGGADGTVRLWDWKARRKMLVLKGHEGPVCGVTFNPEAGGQLASAGADGTVRLWDWKTGKDRILLKGAKAVRCVAFSPDGKLLAFGGDDGSVGLWEGGSAAPKTVGHHDQPVRSVAFFRAPGPVGWWLASGSGGETALFPPPKEQVGVIKIWDLKAQSPWRNLPGNFGPIHGLAAFRQADKEAKGPRVQLAAACSDSTVQLWDLDLDPGQKREGKEAEAPQPRELVSHTAQEALAVAFSPDGKRVASAGADQTVYITDVAKGSQGRTASSEDAPILTGHTDDVLCVAFEESFAASGGRDGVIHLWDTRRHSESRIVDVQADDVLSVTFSPDGKQFATASQDGTVRLWAWEPDPRDPYKRPSQLPPSLSGGQPAYALAFCPDGRHLAGTGPNGAVHVWDVNTRVAPSVLAGHTGSVRGLTFAPGGSPLASAAEDGSVRLWDWEKGAEKRRLEGHQGGAFAVAFSPSRKELASAGADQSVRIWDTETGQQIRELPGHSGEVYAVAYSTDGKELASAGADRTVRIWDTATWQQQRVLTGHTQPVLCVAFSPTERRLASGDAGIDLKVWDTETGREVFNGLHNYRVHAVAYSPRGDFVATASSRRDEDATTSLKGKGIVKIWGDLATPDPMTTPAVPAAGWSTLWWLAGAALLLPLWPLWRWRKNMGQVKR